MKKVNKRGFTLIEMIGAIIILSVISIIAYATYTSSLRGFRDDYYVEIVRTLEESGKEFFNDNRNYRPQTMLGGQKVSIETLKSNGYVDDITDYNGDKCGRDSYVLIVKEGKDDYSYHTCLVCQGDDFDNREDKYCDHAWLESTNVEYGLGTIEPIYVYKGTPRGELRSLLEVSISYIKRDSKGNVIGEVRGTGYDDVPTILPTNIDEVNTDKVGEYKLNYEYAGQTKQGLVIVYENNAPNFSVKYKDEIAKDLNGTKALEQGNYTSGDWSQRIFVKVSASGTIIEPGVKVSRFQWNKDGRWQDFCVMQDSGVCAPQGLYLRVPSDSDMAGYIEIVQDMNETVEFRMISSNGKISRVSSPIEIKRDNTDPTCELVTEGNMGDNSWYTSNVNVKFKTNYDVANSAGVSKAVSGIKVSNISLSSAILSRTLSNNLQTQTQDTANVGYKGYTEDEAGNFHICEISFRKDGTKPVCGNSGDSTTWIKTSRTINWTCSDVLSQCNPSFSGGSKTYSSTKKTDTIPQYIIKDNAGNTETCAARTADVYVDTTPPVIKLNIEPGKYHDTRTLTLTGEDSDSGVQSVSISGQRTKTVNGSSASVELTEGRSWIVNVSVTDVAGNTSNRNNLEYIIYVTCPSGFKSDGDVFEKTSCYVNVPAGSYKPDANNSKTELCAAGKYKEAHKSYYGSTDSCTNCPKGTYRGTTGGTSVASCTNCAKGTYAASEGSTVCTKCAKGTYSTAEKATSASTCVKCEAGTYSSSDGSTSCTKCLAGTYNTGTGNTGCTDCPAGKYCTGGSHNQNCPSPFTTSPKKSPAATSCYRTVTISFNANGGSSDSSKSCTINYNNSTCKITTPGAPTKSGYTFKGWSTSSTASSGTGTNVELTVSSNTTYYATWQANCPANYTLKNGKCEREYAASYEYHCPKGGSLNGYSCETRTAASWGATEYSGGCAWKHDSGVMNTRDIQDGCIFKDELDRITCNATTKGDSYKVYDCGEGKVSCKTGEHKYNCSEDLSYTCSAANKRYTYKNWTCECSGSLEYGYSCSSGYLDGTDCVSSYSAEGHYVCKSGGSLKSDGITCLDSKNPN